MNKILAVVAFTAALSSPVAHSMCLVVSNLHGTSYSPLGKYTPGDVEYEGNFRLYTNDKDVSVKYSDGGDEFMKYTLFPSGFVVGMGRDGSMQRVESWAIKADGKVMVTKSQSGTGYNDYVQSLVGEVTGKC